MTQYRERLDSQQRLAEQSAAQLQQQHRMAEYRFQQQYLARLRQQHAALQRARDYNNDPYYYTAPIYRYNRGGSYYETNEYGAKLLRQAVNNGYAQGFRAGRAARQDRWTSGYQNSYAYQDANYGYDGYYVEQADYNYYFREGFSRGYEDGYNSRYRYGRYSGGSYSILGGILSQIPNPPPRKTRACHSGGRKDGNHETENPQSILAPHSPRHPPHASLRGSRGCYSRISAIGSPRARHTRARKAKLAAAGLAADRARVPTASGSVD